MFPLKKYQDFCRGLELGFLLGFHEQLRWVGTSSQQRSPLLEVRGRQKERWASSMRKVTALCT